MKAPAFGAMSKNPKLSASQGFAAVALFLALLNDLGLANGIGVKPAVTGISAFVFAVVAFAITARTGSALVSSFLTLQGVADVAASASAGATIGIPFGSTVLVLGLAKAVMTWRRAVLPGKASPRSRFAIGRALVALAVVLAAVVAGIGLYVATAPPTSATTTSSTSYAGPPPVQVSIYKGAASSSDPPGYAPDSIVLVIGVNNTVTWTNNDSVHHTVTSISAPSGGSFSSGNMNGGAVYTHTFTVPGTYKYNCAYHSWMTGTIVVEAGSQ